MDNNNMTTPEAATTPTDNADVSTTVSLSKETSDNGAEPSMSVSLEKESATTETTDNQAASTNSTYSFDQSGILGSMNNSYTDATGTNANNAFGADITSPYNVDTNSYNTNTTGAFSSGMNNTYNTGADSSFSSGMNNTYNTGSNSSFNSGMNNTYGGYDPNMNMNGAYNNMNNGYQNYQQMPPTNSTSAYEVASLILGILSILSCACYGIISIIFSILGIVFANLYKKEYKTYSSLAKAGLITSCVGLTFGIIFILLLVIGIIFSFTIG